MTVVAIKQRLRDFTTDLLEQTGGVVDWPTGEEEGAAVAPPEVAAQFGLPDESFAVTTQGASQGLVVSLATDFLEMAGNVLEKAVPRVASFRISQRYLKKGDLVEAISRAYTWLNVRVKVREAVPAAVDYHTWWLQASLRSEDTWESCLRLTLNSQSLAELDFLDPLDLVDLEPAPDIASAAPNTLEVAAQRAAHRALQAADGFLKRMDARLDRDKRRLQNYYGALVKEAGATNRRTKHAPSPEEIAEKRLTVQIELRRKLAELDQRYAIEALVRPVALSRMSVPILAVELEVQRKQARRIHVVYWNSLTKQFEPLACSRCHAPAFAVAFTNDDVLPLCARCSERDKSRSG